MSELSLNYVRSHFPVRPDDAHKGSMGALCCVTGSFGYAGAAILCARAALRSGVGLLYQVLPERIYPIFTVSTPEAVCIPMDPFSDLDAVITRINACTAAVIGCGLQNTADTAALTIKAIKNADVPLLLDADALNSISGNADVIDSAHVPLILTPHPKEFSRLTGESVSDILRDPKEAAARFCQQHRDVVLVLKGHRTVIAQNDRMMINTAGNPGMAKGGSGDVLSGIIGALLARGAEPFDAAAMGVHIHALAGDSAAEALSRTAMLPSDMIECLAEVYIKIEA